MRDCMGKPMEAKDFSRFFGGFSNEKRVKLLSALIEAGKPGLSLLDLSRKTELSVIDIGIAAEALLMIDLLDISIKGENKMLYANFALLHSVFEKSYDVFGSGRDKVHASAPILEDNSASDAAAESDTK